MGFTTTASLQVMMKTQGILTVVAVGALLVSAATGQDQDAEAKALQGVIATYTKAREEYAKDLEKANEDGNDDLRRELAQRRPNAMPIVERARTFIESSPQHEATPSIARWLLLFLRDEDRSFIYDALLRHHLGHPELASTTLSALYDLNEESTVFLDAVRERSEQAQARAAALFVLGYRLRHAQGEEAEKRIEYLRMAVEDLGDLELRERKVKVIAEGQLFEAENLAIGKVAPEIVGEDVNGVRFKLSDYRGKVVVLDFWGHW
jgi:hypothetical protein